MPSAWPLCPGQVLLSACLEYSLTVYHFRFQPMRQSWVTDNAQSLKNHLRSTPKYQQDPDTATVTQGPGVIP